MDFKELGLIFEKIPIELNYGLKINQVLTLADVHSLLHEPGENAIYILPDNTEIDLNSLSVMVSPVYSSVYELYLIERSSSVELAIHKIEAENLMGKKRFKKGGYIFFPAVSDAHSFSAFVELIAHLRSPKGCPWDRKQTHASLRTTLLEETYEVLEAIDEKDMNSLKEELGDLLLQIVLQSQIASEEGVFTIHSVIEDIYKKIVFRHPHIFKDWKVKGVEEVIKNWEILKAQERSEKNRKPINHLLDSIPKSLPALSLAQKYQERAARVGFDWTGIAPVIEKIEEEIGEFKNAPDMTSRERELGDLLFAMVNLIRWYGLDAESVLRQMNERFRKRFNFIEENAAAQGRKITDLSLAEMDEIWEKAKHI